MGNVLPTGFVTSRSEGRKAVPMARLPGNIDGDFSSDQSQYDADADIADLFASRPPAEDEFSDPNVQTRIAMLITRAMNKPTRPPR
jgi:hypothetical protein